MPSVLQMQKTTLCLVLKIFPAMLNVLSSSVGYCCIWTCSVQWIIHGDSSASSQSLIAAANVLDFLNAVQHRHLLQLRSELMCVLVWVLCSPHLNQTFFSCWDQLEKGVLLSLIPYRWFSLPCSLPILCITTEGERIKPAVTVAYCCIWELKTDFFWFWPSSFLFTPLQAQI